MKKKQNFENRKFREPRAISSFAAHRHSSFTDIYWMTSNLQKSKIPNFLMAGEESSMKGKSYEQL